MAGYNIPKMCSYCHVQSYWTLFIYQGQCTLINKLNFDLQSLSRLMTYIKKRQNIKWHEWDLTWFHKTKRSVYKCSMFAFLFTLYTVQKKLFHCYNYTELYNADSHDNDGVILSPPIVLKRMLQYLINTGPSLRCTIITSSAKIKTHADNTRFSAVRKLAHKMYFYASCVSLPMSAASFKHFSFMYWLAALAQPACPCPWLAGDRGHVADQVSFQGLLAGTWTSNIL